MITALLTILHYCQWLTLASQHVSGPMVTVVHGHWSQCMVIWHGANAYANACTFIGR